MFNSQKPLFKSAPPVDMSGNQPSPGPSTNFSPNPAAVAAGAPFISGSQAFVTPAVIDGFIPGYSLISAFILSAFGIDISHIISAVVVAFAFFTLCKYFYTGASQIWRTYFMSSITVNNDQKIYRYLVNWVAETKIPTTSRNLCAKSKRKDWEEELDLIKTFKEQENNSNFNFKDWESQSAPSFEPNIGVHSFWHKGRLILLTRREREVQPQGGWYWSMRSDVRESIILSTFGRSTEPLKQLLQESKRWYLAKEKSNTAIMHPTGSSHDCIYWTLATLRPSRPMDTIYISDEDKLAVIEDINQYLHPESRPWYASRGIPYRRGFLFHGPPGTGKTSLSFALAGVFGLDVYVLSLMDPKLTEDALKELFSRLPRRCIVLLEDIDTAGVRRKAIKQAQKEDADSSKDVESSKKAVKKSPNEAEGISLSGLLNAIDGVASHEGRLLIMTSNHPEKLDDALIRPGRVDMKIAFANATKVQAKTLFMQMFSPDSDRKAEALLGEASVKKAVGHVDLEKLVSQAQQFADIVPEDSFTPAEVQGFLLTRRKNPQQAVDEAAAWKDKLLADKEERRRQAAEEASDKS